MAMPDRKPLAAIILAGKAKPPGNDDGGDKGDEDAEPEQIEPDDEEIAACQDMIDAFTKKDAGELSMALRHWMDIAGYSRGEEE